MRRKELWQKIATRDCGVKQYKYLYRRIPDASMGSPGMARRIREQGKREQHAYWY